MTTATPDPATRYMARALRLAVKGLGRTSPNPMVGAVVVRDGEVVGSGFHAGAGHPHAEAEALRMAGPDAAGADLYVTLEPCCHHGRTPPCVDAVLGSGVRRIFAAMEDPDPRVRGLGIRTLRQAGVTVEVGLLGAQAARLNEAFCRRVTSGMPFVTLKMAMSLDGKIATHTGDSRWVTSETSRRLVHRLRRRNDAVLVGVGTVRADDPSLTVRLRRQGTPLRVVLDPRCTLALSSTIARTARELPALVACAESCPAAAKQQLQEAGLELLPLPERAGKLDLRSLLSALAERGLNSLLVEGGAETAASFLTEGLVDRVQFFVAPILVGGRAAPGPVGGVGVDSMGEALRLYDVSVRRVGHDWLFTADVHRDH